MATDRCGGGLEGGLNRAWSGARSSTFTLTGVAADTRLLWAGRVVAVALAIGMLLSPDLWLTRPAEAPIAESFPQVPPVPGLEVLAPPTSFDTALFVGTLVLCALVAALPRRTIYTVLFFACLLLALPDLMRWQPWFCLYAGKETCSVSRWPRRIVDLSTTRAQRRQTGSPRCWGASYVPLSTRLELKAHQPNSSWF